MNQQNLFGDSEQKPNKPKKAPERPLTARELKIKGMKQVAENTEEKVPGWRDRALEYVREFAITHETLYCEQVRYHAESMGFDLPSHPRAWGPVMTDAKKKNWVEKIGAIETKNPKAHQALEGLWKSLLWKG